MRLARYRARLRGLGSNGTGTIQDILPGAVFELHAGSALSYPGTGQTVSNLIKAPSTGQAQTAFDMYLGTTSSGETSDPTFTGTAGVPGAYFLCDGGDNLLSINTPGTSDWLANLTRTDQNNDWWAVVAGRYADSGATAHICGNASSGTNDGFRISLNAASTNAQFYTCNGTACVLSTFSSVHTYGTDTLVVLKYNSQTREIKRAYNSRTLTTATHAAFTNTDSLSPAKMGWGAAITGNRVGNGSRLYHFAMGQGDIDNTTLGRIADYINAKNNITFV